MAVKMASLISIILLLSLFLFSCEEQNEQLNSENGANADNDDLGGEKVETIARVLPVKGGANGIVVLMHDDGYTGTVERFDILLNKHGLVGDIALVTSFVYNTSTHTPKMGEVQKFRDFLATGRWKIVSHSYTHEWWGINGVENAERMREEIVGSQEILRELFPGESVLTFAYPGLTAAVKQYGQLIVFSEGAQSLIEKTYISGRKDILEGPLDITSSLNWKRLSGFGFLNGSVKNGTIENIVKKTAENGGLAILYTHQIKSGTDTKESADAATYGNIQMGSYYMDIACGIIADEVNSGRIWNTHYEDAILYLREAEGANISTTVNEDGSYSLTLTDGMDDEIYNYPLTVRISLPDGTKTVQITQGDEVCYPPVKQIDGKLYVDADIIPDRGEVSVIMNK